MAKRVLILCTGNSARSQMAEGLWNHAAQGAWQADSAGSAPAGYVHPKAVQVMKEVGIDISDGASRHVVRYASQRFDLVVTVCDQAAEACPTLPRAKQVLHWPFEDPAAAAGSEADQLETFRRVRDQISQRIGQYLTAQSAADQSGAEAS